MSIPLSIILYDRGAGGVPTTNNPVNLAGRVESYEDALSDRYGFETARVSWTPTVGDIDEWNRFDHLLRPMVAFSPDARIAWEGVLAEIEIEFGTKKIAFSLKDMANRLTVRFSEPGGAQGDSATYSNAASQALFGIKDRVINASIAASAAASNQAQTILNVLAFPRSKQPSSAGTPRGGLTISLTFWGKYALLDWLLTSNTSTATTASSTQIASLLAAYAAVNPFFATSAANIAATGVADTEYIEPDTTYREKIERLLARGNSAQQPLAWGFYENGVFTVAPRASATPAAITYYESEASGQIRDAWQNVVDPWDVRPNAMALIVDLIDAPTVGAAETPLRKYVARVTRSVRGSDVTVTLEPEDTENIEDLLTAPAGAGPAGTSDRQAAFERKVTAPGRSVFAGVDNDSRYDRTAGVWKPRSGGTGKSNSGTLDVPSDGTIDLGGGSISTGGGTITYPSGGGTAATGSGTTGALTKWTDGPSGVLGNATAGTDYAAASHNHAASQITSGTMATARLGSGSASSSTFLRGDSTWQAISTIAPADIGAAPVGAKYIVQTADATLTNEQALGALATGLLKNTTTTGVLSIAAAADLPDHASRHANGGADELALDTSQITTGTMATARLGSGTANSTKYLAGDSTWQTTPTGTVGGTGTAGRAAMWAVGGANVATSNLDIDGLTSVLTLLTSGAYTITFPATGTVALLGSANTFTSSMSVALGLNIGGASGAGTGEIAASGLVDAAGGFYVSGTKIIGARRTGWGGPTGTATRTTFATSTVTLPQLAERMKALIDDLSTHGIIGG